MKRFITGAIAAAALLFGFAGCSNLHDMDDAPIAKVPTKIVGAMTYTTTNVFEDMTVVDSTTSTYTFKYTTAMSANWGSPSDGVNFKVGYAADEWATCWSQAAAGTTALVSGTGSVVCKAQNAENISFSGLTNGKTYKITATTGIASVTVTIAQTTDAAADPTPYYLDGMYLVGGCFTTGSMTNLWSFGPDNLIHGAATETKTGYVTYTKDITATVASGEMGINDSNWGNKQLGSGVTVTVGTDYADLNGTAGNFTVSGLTSGDPYRIYIQTTPEKVVSVKLEKIVSYTVKCVVTGIKTEGTEVFVNGSLWNNWGNTWPFAAWDGGKAYADAKTGDNAGWFATADSTGTATFAGSITSVTKPGTTISGEVKVVDCGPTLSAPASINYDNNGKYSFVVTSSGTYVIKVDVGNSAYTCTYDEP
ncbi:MAG: hypothetical protein M0P01_12520 [Treponema sp.]|nr:hypothetical protein [Treponema sp.]